MKILIAESDPNLGGIWRAHLLRQGAEVELATSGEVALDNLAKNTYDLLVLSQSLGEDEALNVADYASYRHPEIKVIFVTRTRFFADGSVFAHCPNACACLPEHTPPQDLAALVEYHLSKVA